MLTEYPISNVDYEQDDFVVLTQQYSIEILTKKTIFQDDSFFSFINLFESKVFL